MANKKQKFIVFGLALSIFSTNIAVSANSVYGQADQQYQETKNKKSNKSNKKQNKKLNLDHANVGSTKERASDQVIAAANAGNSYMGGTCAAYVSARMSSLGMSIPPFLGDAGSWAYSGPQQGLTESEYPQPGSIVVFQAGQFGASGWGHVGVVEEVREDGSWVISEMTWQVQSERTFTASDANDLTFLLPADHDSSKIKLAK